MADRLAHSFRAIGVRARAGTALSPRTPAPSTDAARVRVASDDNEGRPGTDETASR